MRPAVFLDRDGTLNHDIGWLHDFRDWVWIPGAIEALRLLNGSGYATVVDTNQAGVARGLYTEAHIAALHELVAAEAAAAGARIDAFYYCPHHPEFGDVRDCACRKPGPGMIVEAQRTLQIDLERSYIIGDRLSDVEAGRAAGVTGMLVKTGSGAEEYSTAPLDVPVFEDVLAAARFITGTR